MKKINLNTTLIIVAIVAIISVCLFRINSTPAKFHKLLYHLSYSLLICIFAYEKLKNEVLKKTKGIYWSLIIVFGFGFLYNVILIFIKLENYNAYKESIFWSFFSVGLVLFYLIKINFFKK